MLRIPKLLSGARGLPRCHKQVMSQPDRSCVQPAREAGQGAAHHKQSHQPPSVAVTCSTPSALATCLAAHYSLLTNCCSTPCSEPTCRHSRILHRQCKKSFSSLPVSDGKLSARSALFLPLYETEDPAVVRKHTLF